MNRIKALFREQGSNKILSVYYTAGYPGLNDTMPLLQELQDSGVDMVELGIPFSDPLADGPTIQKSSEVALRNGMTLDLLFSQLKEMRSTIRIPVLLMGYLNPVMQFGVEKFIDRCCETGIDGVIIPDLPMDDYIKHYRSSFRAKDVCPVFLITPQTSEARIRNIDGESEGFIYMVSSASVTGSSISQNEDQKTYFSRVKNLALKNPTLVGFGISDRESFEFASSYSRGAIVGSAFIKAITGAADWRAATRDFVHRLRNH
jgi:tryptophan synthase alpha chain